MNITEGKLNIAQRAIVLMAADIASRGDARVTGVRMSSDGTWDAGAMSMRGASLAGVRMSSDGTWDAGVMSMRGASLAGVRMSSDGTWIIDYFIWDAGAMSMRGESLADAWLNLAHKLAGTEKPPF